MFHTSYFHSPLVVLLLLCFVIGYIFLHHTTNDTLPMINQRSSTETYIHNIYEPRYWTVWSTTALLTYATIELGNVDAIALIAKVDGLTGYEISTKIDPTIGTIGLTMAINEMLEPLRLPVVVLTTKPVVEAFSPRHY